MNKKIVIELRGVEFVNKGAELMLHSIIQYVRSEIPNVVFAMEDVLQLSPRRKHLQYGIYTKTGFQIKRYNKFRFFINLSFLSNFLSKQWRDNHLYVEDKDINIVLDGSGFAFGDQWGAEYAGKVLADAIEGWKRNGKKIVLLPQAFGPFRSPKLQEKMKIISNNSDLIFARDPVSFTYLTELLPDNKSIFLYPDFTNLIKGYIPKYFNEDFEVAIIPNFKMISATTVVEGDAYIEMLKCIIQYTIEKGFAPYFLIHEGNKDAQLAKEINRKYFSSKIKIVIDDDPLAVKGMIGASKAVVTARFHGLVSALSQGVPCLATGWSHKYEMLLSDYSYSEALLDVKLSVEDLKKKVDYILNSDTSDLIKKKLQERGSEEKIKSKEMWDLVIKLVKSIK